MKRAAVTTPAILFMFSAFCMEYYGFVIVHDETGMAVEAKLSGLHEQKLSSLPFGYFAGIPNVEGGITVRCSDGTSVHGGYVTAHAKVSATVTGHETCDKLQ